MLRSKDIIPFIKTILISVIIMIAGYKIVAIAGDYFITDNTPISTISAEKKDAYVFYSQARNDLTLYPWNYYENATPFHYIYGSDTTASDIIDTVNLYDYLVYYFYRIIPAYQKTYIDDIGTSFGEYLDYDNLDDHLSVYDSGYIYYYYKNTISINNVSYDIEFSFAPNGVLYSFLCQEAHTEADYTDDVMTYANSYLSTLINANNQSYIYMLFDDMTFLSHALTNYILIVNNSSDISLNISPEAEKNEYSDKYNMLPENENIYAVENETAFTTNSEDTNNYVSENEKLATENNSFQIVKTATEYLIIESSTNLVLHFDPLQRVFVGFNLSEEYW